MSTTRFLSSLMLAGIIALSAMPSIARADEAAPAAVVVEEKKAEAPAAPAATVAEQAKPAEETAAPAAEAEQKEESKPKSYFSGKFWALVPPLVAIILALITKEVFSSLFIGIVIAALFVGQGSFLPTMDAIINEGLISAVKDTAGVFIFLVVLGIMVALLNRAGAAKAFGDWAKDHVHSRIGAMLATFVLGVLIFIDDYFNCLTVGSVMLPVTDSKRVSRAKLAYMIDATAAPICMIAPISSWAAAVSSYAGDAHCSGIELFCRAIPYNFYSLLTIIFVVAIILFKLDFGPMATHERNAIEKGDLFTNGGEVDNGVRAQENPNGRIFDLFLPIFVLIIVCVFAMLYVGGFLNGADFITAFSDTDATVALPWGGILALIVTLLYFFARSFIKIPPRTTMFLSGRETMNCVPAGFVAMVPAILILTLATTLKNLTGVLEAKEYIAGIMQGQAAGLGHFLPVIIFIVACILAFATGTSWGTFGILIPIVVNIFNGEPTMLYIGMSACLAGAVCGDHCSPISDTTIMSSAGARCEHINHVSTQLPYAIYVAAISAIGFLLAGFCQNWYVVFPITVAIMLLGLVVIKVIAPKSSK